MRTFWTPKPPERPPEAAAFRARLLNEWVKRLPWAGIPGAVSYHWDGQHWVDHRLSEADRILRRHSLNYTLEKNGDDFTLTVMDP